MDYFLILLAVVFILATTFVLHQRRIPIAVTSPVMVLELIYLLSLNGLTGFYRCCRRGDRGAASIEYAILGSLIAAGIILVVMNLGNQLRFLLEASASR